MFEFLYNADANQALAGVHFALRRITHRQTLPTTYTVPELLSDDESLVDAELGLKVIGEIERTEQRPLSSLNSERAYYYKDMLATLAQNLAKQSFAYDKAVGRNLLKGWREEQLLNVSTISVPSLPLSPAKVWALGSYLMVGMTSVAYFTYALWPGVSPDSYVTLIPRLLRIAVSPETRLLLLAMVSGALGSFVHTSRAFAWYVGNRKLSNNWIWWFLMQPFAGMLLALACYFLIRAGFLSASANVADINVFGVTAGSALVGMFSASVVGKLEEVFSVLFNRGEANDVPGANSNGSRLKRFEHD